MLAIIDMLILAVLLAVFSPVIVLYRILSGDKYMPPRDRL